uniref:SCP domain-containing protein n=1 Tax=Caenorhabditis tropicalis TaxID=1561998 RepID=A0A1I7UGQ4_9PELO
MNLLILLLTVPSMAIAMTGHDFVIELNKKRVEFAKKFNIGNMNELVWDQQLAVKTAESAEELKTNGKLESYASYEDILESVNGTLGIEKKDLKRWQSYYKMQFLAPLHNRIGCTTVPDENKSESYCYLVPDSPLDKMLDTYGFIGSRCSEGFETNTEGLCRPITTTTVPTTITTPTEKESNSTAKNQVVENAEDAKTTENVDSSASFPFNMLFVLIPWLFFI